MGKTPILVNFPENLLRRVDVYKDKKNITTRTQAILLLIQDSLDYEEIVDSEVNNKNK